MSDIGVFVYGTLKPTETNYKYYCQGKVKSQLKAYTWGNLYHLSLGYPAMTRGKNKVWGILLTFNNPNILYSLDTLESYQENRQPELNEYYRDRILVYDSGDLILGDAWAYFMSETKVKQFDGIPINSGWWSGL